jgi:hypothetical protein
MPHDFLVQLVGTPDDVAGAATPHLEPGPAVP